MEENIFMRKLCGGEVKFIIYNVDRGFVEEIVDEIYLEGLRLQKIFNFYDSKSELNLLNKKRRMKVSKELLEVLEFGLDLAELTNGNLDVSFGKYILNRKKGIDDDAKCSYKDIVISGNLVELKGDNVLIDLGSIAKGYIAEKLADKLEENGIEEFLIDARGDIVVRGGVSHVLGVQNPRDEGDVGKIELKNSSVATSGDYNQFVGDFDKSHILNQKDLISVSVVGNSLFKCDGYATAIFVCPEKVREKVIGKIGERVLVIDNTNNLKIFNGFRFDEKGN